MLAKIPFLKIKSTKNICFCAFDHKFIFWITLLADGCDTWELLAFEGLEHCSTTC